MAYDRLGIKPYGRKAENNGQHESDQAPAINSGQKTSSPPAAHSENDRWGARDNMRVPASSKTENLNGDTQVSGKLK